MTAAELAAKGAPLSPREQQLAGSANPKFVPGEKGYRLEPNRKLKDTSAPKQNNSKTYAEYQQERLAPLAAGLSGSTDWYFNVANQLGLDENDKKKLRLAALGQMLVNRDHSFHEVMHEARTQGKLHDYPDELPIGYTTLSPLNEGQILSTANNAAEFPGDQEAEAFKNADTQGQVPQGLAAAHGLPTATGLKHLAGDPSRRYKVFGGGEKGKKYLAILAALDNYNTANTNQGKRQQLQTISTTCAAWLSSHKNPKRDSLQAKRVDVMVWLKAKAEAMYNDKAGPPAPPWIAAEYFDNAESAEAAIMAQLQQDVVSSSLTPAAQQQLFQKALAKVNALMATQDLDGLSDFRARLIREVNRSEDVTSSNFVASTADLSLDMNIQIAAKDLPTTYALMGRDWLKVLKENASENVKLIREARTRNAKDYNNNADLDKAPPAPPNPVLANWPEKMRVKKEAEAQQAVKDDVDKNYSQHIEDFQDNIDTSVLARVAPGTPVDEFLSRLKGQPMPKELAAIAAYAEDGFYQNMNHVLNNWNDKAFLSTVPPELLKLCRLAVSGLRKMKPYAGGSVYRGIPGYNGAKITSILKRPLAERQQIWQQGLMGDWTSKQFLSTSKRIGSSYAVKKGKFIAIEIQDIKTGVDISAISNTLHEREVLFPPGAPIKAKSVTDKFVNLDQSGQVVPGSEQNKLDIPYEDRTEPGRIQVVLGEE